MESSGEPDTCHGCGHPLPPDGAGCLAKDYGFLKTRASMVFCRKQCQDAMTERLIASQWAYPHKLKHRLMEEETDLVSRKKIGCGIDGCQHQAKMESNHERQRNEEARFAKSETMIAAGLGTEMRRAFSGNTRIYVDIETIADDIARRATWWHHHQAARRDQLISEEATDIVEGALSSIGESDAEKMRDAASKEFREALIDASKSLEWYDTYRPGQRRLYPTGGETTAPDHSNANLTRELSFLFRMHHDPKKNEGGTINVLGLGSDARRIVVSVLKKRSLVGFNFLCAFPFDNSDLRSPATATTTQS